MIDLRRLSEVNRSRCTRWHGAKGINDWSPERWLVATTGEFGEAAAALDELNSGGVGPDFQARKAKIGEEFADFVIYADLFNQSLGINSTMELASAVFSGNPNFLKIAGALGEAANAMKKMFRIEGEMANLSEDAERHVTSIAGAKKIIGQNIAKAIFFTDAHLKLHRMDLMTEIIKKFNSVSERYGFPERL